LLEDQQLGGLIMWIPAGFVFVFAGVAVAMKAIMPGWNRPTVTDDDGTASRQRSMQDDQLSH
jgi:cytochrome c oxidase assembly factor CtaG